eukprot:5512460-Amphidinium_carterae.3
MIYVTAIGRSIPLDRGSDHRGLWVSMMAVLPRQLPQNMVCVAWAPLGKLVTTSLPGIGAANTRTVGWPSQLRNTTFLPWVQQGIRRQHTRIMLRPTLNSGSRWLLKLSSSSTATKLKTLQ